MQILDQDELAIITGGDSPYGTVLEGVGIGVGIGGAALGAAALAFPPLGVAAAVYGVTGAVLAGAGWAINNYDTLNGSGGDITPTVGGQYSPINVPF